MEYNQSNNYVDTNVVPNLDNKTLNKMVWRSLFLQASFNFERMQAAGWLYSILPGLEKIHTNKDDLSKSMTHNLEFFNTHPFLVTFVMGIVLSLEQNKQDIDTIRAVRVAAMGPLGGIGDALFWFTLVPILAGITSNMALSGQIIAPFLFLLVFNLAQFGLRYWLMYWSYKKGVEAIDLFTQNAKEFTRAASILGVIIVGALTVLYGGIKTKYEIPNGKKLVKQEIKTVVSNDKISDFEKYLYKDDKKTLKPDTTITDLKNGTSELVFQKENEVDAKINVQKILDGIIPNIIDLGLVMLMYFFIAKKKLSPVYGIIFLFVLGLFGAWIGIF